jgi:hypothetical protein
MALVSARMAAGGIAAAAPQPCRSDAPMLS